MSEIKKGSRVRTEKGQFSGTVTMPPLSLVVEVLWTDGVVSHALKSALVVTA